MVDISIVNGTINQLLTGGAPPCSAHISWKRIISPRASQRHRLINVSSSPLSSPDEYGSNLWTINSHKQPLCILMNICTFLGCKYHSWIPAELLRSEPGSQSCGRCWNLFCLDLISYHLLIVCQWMKNTSAQKNQLAFLWSRWYVFREVVGTSFELQEFWKSIFRIKAWLK